MDIVYAWEKMRITPSRMEKQIKKKNIYIFIYKKSTIDHCHHLYVCVLFILPFILLKIVKYKKIKKLISMQSTNL